MRTAGGLLVLAVTLALASPAPAAVLCSKPKDGTFDGVVRVREACRDKETQLDPAALGLTGSRAYGSFSNDSGSAYNVTIGGVSVDFFDTAAAQNVSLTTPIATLADPGTYRIGYCIRLTASSSASTRLVVNGSAINASIITPVTPTNQYCRSTALSLVSSNSTVQVQLFGALVPVTLIAPGGAELVIERLD